MSVQVAVFKRVFPMRVFVFPLFYLSIMRSISRRQVSHTFPGLRVFIIRGDLQERSLRV